MIPIKQNISEYFTDSETVIKVKHYIIYCFVCALNQITLNGKEIKMFDVQKYIGERFDFLKFYRT